MRRILLAVVAVAGLTLAFVPLPAPSAPPALSQADAASGIKESMAQGVSAAIRQLGQPDGFLKDQAVKILLPKNVQRVADAARKVGAGKYVDELELAMNRAAEQAVPAAADVFGEAVRQMTVQDALAIVRGGDDAGTQYFRRVTEDSLRAKFRPIVEQSTAKTGVAQRYKALNEKGGGLGKLLGGGKETDLDGYVTEKAMDGLFFYVAKKEAEIRKNPLKQGSELLGRVFGR
jgi:hypothetical protein